MLHKARLFYLRNRITLGFTILSFVMLTMLFMQIMLVSATLKQSQRNEEILKGLSCILLIMPEDRNVSNVKECVIRNRSVGDGEFDFTPASYATPSDMPVIELQKPVSSTAKLVPQAEALTEKPTITTSSVPPEPKTESKPRVTITPKNHSTDTSKQGYDDDTLWHLISGGK